MASVDSARHSRIKELFAAACLEPAAERMAFLDRMCRGDDDLRREIESLLAFYDDRPLGNDAAPRLRAQSRSQPARPRLRRGRVLAGRYRVERLLGQGGMGEVYEVFDASLRETVALKILPGASAEQRRRLVEEVRLARQVTHPAVCRVYDFGEDAGTPFLTMQLIEGETLATRLERTGAMSSEDVAAIARRLASALAAAHEAGVLHRDLKPSNVLVGKNGLLYITDFGIATGGSRSRHDANGSTRRFGTPAYMAPEECDNGGVATQQTDLYSLGLILYELLTGAVPFDAPDLDTVLEMQQTTLPEPPSRLVPEVDGELEVLILQLLAKDPAQRPESAASVLAALGPPLELRARSNSTPAPVERRDLVTLSAQLAPSPLAATRAWPALVRTFQTRCAAACRLRGGSVARHLPDGIVVHFGVRRAREDDAERAVEAALAIDAERRQHPLVDSETALHAEVTIDLVPVTLREGRVARTSAPSQTQAPFATGLDSVLVSRAALPLLRGSFTTAELEARGEDDLHWHRIVRSRERRALDGGVVHLTPFVGRALELAQLEQCWHAARNGTGQVVLLSGEAGLGKTRIAHELWTRVRGESVAYEVRCSSLHSNTPLHPFVSMMTQLARIVPEDGAAERIAKLRRALAPLGDRAEEFLPIMAAWLLGSRLQTTGVATLPAADRRTALAVIEECLRIMAESRPVLLLCEDLHWSDPTTREAIDRLVSTARSTRVCLVLTFRPDFNPTWRGTGIIHLALQPLPENEARALLSTLGSAADGLLQRADGNPLYLEELAKHASESVGALDRGAVPPSLRGLLSERFDRLGAARALAQTAAVCGRSVTYPVLRAIAAERETPDGFDHALARLLDADILVQRGFPPHATLTFRHGLLRDVAYDSLPALHRRRIHGRAASALPDLDPDDCDTNPELVAGHWERAARRDRAFQWWKRAGMRALERSAYSEAEHNLTRAQETLSEAVEPGARRREKLDLELALTSLEMGRQGPGSAAAAQHARRAQSLVAGMALDDEVARAVLLAARVRFARGELGATLRVLEPLWAFEERIADPYLRASVLTQASNLLSCVGRLDEAERLQDRVIDAYATAREQRAGTFTNDPLAHLLMIRAGNDWMRGRDSASRRWADAAVAHADAIGHPFTRAMIHVLGASLELRRGDRVRFAARLAEGTRLAHAVGSRWLIDLANVYTAIAGVGLDRAERARRLRLTLEATPGSWLYRSIPISELALQQEQLGLVVEADETMKHAVTEARRRDPAMAPEIERRRGDLLARLGRHQEAEAALRRALQSARRSGAYGLELRCGLSLARWLDAERRPSAARRLLAALLDRLPDDVDAPERAEAAALLIALAHPEHAHRLSGPTLAGDGAHAGSSEPSERMGAQRAQPAATPTGSRRRGRRARVSPLGVSRS